MRLKSLYLENIKNHESLLVDFSNGITAIIGKNGKGKTTILESIGFVLFDYLPYKQKEFITHGKTWGEIAIRLDINGMDVNIVRRIGNNPKYYIQFTESQIHGKEDVQEWIKENLKIDMDLEKLYSEIIAIPQGLATAHFMLPKTQRGQVFDSILGVDIYRDCWSKLQPVQKLVQDEISRLEGDIKILEHDTYDYEEKKKDLEDMDAEIEDLEVKIVLTEKAYEELDKERKKLSILDDDAAKYNWLKDIVNGLRDDINGAKDELNSIVIEHNRDEIKKKLDELDSKYNAYQCGVLALNEAERNVSSYGNDITNYEKEIKRLQSITLENLCPVTGDKCNVISADKIKGINNEIKGIKKTVNEIKELYAEEDKKRNILSDGLKKLEKELIEYNELRDLYDDIVNKEFERDKLIDYIDKTNVELGKKEKELNEINDKLQKYDEDRLRFVEDECIKLRDTLSRLEERCSQIELQRPSEYNEILEIEEMLEKLQKYRNEYKEDEVLLERIKKIREIFRDVGCKLVDNYLNNISYEANQIYQELMDTTETLEWDNSYELKVGDKKFQQLSGGQQMCAAISVRLSLLKYFSNMNLIILDEPTANLDDERREALAESIRKLENNNQILVVTHDDSFSTITDNVLTLKNI